jgi:hypothetical protein
MTITVLSYGLNAELLKGREQALVTSGCVVTCAFHPAQFINHFFDGDFDLLVLCRTIPAPERQKILRMVMTHRPSMKVIVVDSQTTQEVSLLAPVLYSEGALIQAVHEAFPVRIRAAGK